MHQFFLFRLNFGHFWSACFYHLPIQLSGLQTNVEPYHYDGNIALAGGGRGRLRAEDVVKHVLAVLEDDTCRTCFGTDHCTILFKDILGLRRYWPQLRKEHWQGTVITFTSLFHFLHSLFCMFLEVNT
jgi:hypothetical protein